MANGKCDTMVVETASHAFISQGNWRVLVGVSKLASLDGCTQHLRFRRNAIVNNNKIISDVKLIASPFDVRQELAKAMRCDATYRITKLNLRCRTTMTTMSCTSADTARCYYCCDCCHSWNWWVSSDVNGDGDDSNLASFVHSKRNLIIFIHSNLEWIRQKGGTRKLKSRLLPWTSTDARGRSTTEALI